MDIKIEKKDNNLHIIATIKPKIARGNKSVFETEDLIIWIEKNHPDCDLSAAELIKAPKGGIYNFLGESYLSGEWIFSLKPPTIVPILEIAKNKNAQSKRKKSTRKAITKKTTSINKEYTKVKKIEE